MTAKIYFHRTPGARFIMPDAREIHFAGGAFSTEDTEVQTELDKVANVPASMIYTTREPIQAMEEKQLKSELISGATQAFDGDKRITGPAETVPMKVEPTPKPTLAALEAAKAAVVNATKK